jgi:hypothetical protein
MMDCNQIMDVISFENGCMLVASYANLYTYATKIGIVKLLLYLSVSLTKFLH